MLWNRLSSPVEIALVRELLRAVRTLEGPLGRVGLHVPVVVALVGEGLAAVVASVGLLPRVDPLVPAEVAAVRERLAAHLARKQLVAVPQRSLTLQM